MGFNSLDIFKNTTGESNNSISASTHRVLSGHVQRQIPLRYLRHQHKLEVLDCHLEVRVSP